jgi:hypothetical protein
MTTVPNIPEDASLGGEIPKLHEEWNRLIDEELKFEREFVEDDVRVRYGKKKGQPLSHRGRKMWLNRLRINFHAQVRVMDKLDDVCKRREAALKT